MILFRNANHHRRRQKKCSINDTLLTKVNLLRWGVSTSLQRLLFSTFLIFIFNLWKIKLSKDHLNVIIGSVDR